MRSIELFKLFGSIGLKGVDEVKNDLDDVSNKGQQTQGKLSKFFSGVGKGAAVAGKAIGVGLAVGGTAMAGLTVKALNLSGELEQNMGGSEAVFGKYAGKMQDTAKSAFSNMGLSTSDYLATANKMGALFQGAGFDIEESMTLSQDAMQRAADVASIMGIDTSAAMEAVAGAAKGNFTMMDNLGVAMNETTLANYALEKGMKKSYDQMTQQEKIGVAMEMFLDKTAYAAGNYAKENETLAGALGTAKSAFKNFLDGSGDVDSLVSAFSNAANVIVDNIQKLLPRLTQGLTDLVNKIMPLIPPLLNSLLPVIIQGAVSLIDGLVSALPGIIDVIVGALPMFIEGVQKIFTGIVEALPQMIESIVKALPTLIPMIIDAMVSMVVTLCSHIDDIILPIIAALPMIISSICTALLDNLPALVDAGKQLLLGLLQGMVALVSKIPEILKTIWNAIVKGIKSLFGIHSPSTVMADIGKNIMQGLINGIKNLVGKCGEVMKSVWNGIKNVFSNVGSWFKQQFSKGAENAKKAWSTVKNFFSNVWSGIKNTFSSVGSWFKNIFTSAKNGIQNAWSGVKNFFSNIKNGIVNAFSNVKEKLTAPFTKARDAIKKIADKIKGFFKGEISMPKIKLPHFSISPKGWSIGDLLKGKIPKLAIDWYAKAMENGMILDEPTIFGMNSSGQLMGAGEAGSETIVGTNSLLDMVHNSVRAETNGLADLLSDLIDMLARFFPQILAASDKPFKFDRDAFVNEIAQPMNAKLGKMQKANARGN